MKMMTNEQDDGNGDAQIKLQLIVKKFSTTVQASIQQWKYKHT